MALFATQTRKWLVSVIRQRKFLIRINKSHKPAAELNTAIETLERQLNAYRYENDLYMARFICQQLGNIETILPGSGSAACRKRQLEFNTIHYQSTLIISGSISFKQLQTSTL